MSIERGRHNRSFLGEVGRNTNRAWRFIDRHYLRPASRTVNRELDRPVRRMSRRDFLRWTVGTLVVSGITGGVLARACEPKPGSNPLVPYQPETKPAVVPLNFTEPFEDKDANAVAKEFGFTAGSLFVVPSEMIPKLSAFLGDELLPIYPPAVMIVYKDLIYKLSKDTGIAPNIIALIMSIESTGYKDAASGAGAQGLFQVMPFHFSDAGIRSEKGMRDPETNGKFGMDVFKYFLGIARKEYPSLPANDPRLIARALMGYNGGYQGIQRPVLPTPNTYKTEDETAFYGDFAIRYMVMAEIAGRLRKRGFSDQEIIRKMHSTEISRRAYALQKYLERQGGEYEPYTRVSRQLAEEIPWQPDKQVITDYTMEQIKGDYQNYDRTPAAHLDYPFSPALELWYRMGGKTLYETRKYSEAVYNQDLKSWGNVYTRK